MSNNRTLKELTIKDNFMFGAVMVDEENCRLFLERVLEFPIERVKVQKEHSLLYRPEYKGVRLDVYAKDEKNTHYDVEMQAVRKAALGKRSRYYHSQIDMELLLKGKTYEALPNTYVIFICDFDPFGQEKYYYSFERVCKEVPTITLQDGSKTIFLSTKGRNPEEVSQELVKFLEFVNADLAESEADFGDEFIRKLQKSIQYVKESREMEGRYMLFEEVMREERNEGIAIGLSEAILQLLESLGDVSPELREKISNQKNVEVLRSWIEIAVKSESLEQFSQKI